MLYTPKVFAAGSALTASAATYYTAPAGIVCSILKELILCNTDTVARTFTVYVVPAAGSAAVANTIFSGVSLQPGESKLFSLSKVMTTGSFLQALASSASVVSLTASGIEVTL